MELAAALLRALRNFLQRDMIYVLGGFSVLLSALVATDSADGLLRQDRLVIWLFIVGVCYIIGFAVQELFCFTRIVTTSALFTPSSVDEFFYERYMREGWKTTKDLDQEAASVEISEASLKQQTLNDMERMVCLLLLTATMGPCAALSGMIIGLSILKTGCCQQLWIAVPICLLGLILIETNRVKAAQYRRYVYTLYSHITEPKSKSKRTRQK